MACSDMYMCVNSALGGGGLRQSPAWLGCIASTGPK